VCQILWATRHTAPQAGTAAVAALYVTDRAGAQPIAATRPRDFDIRRTIRRSPGLPFNGIHPRNPRIYIDYYCLFADPKAEGGR